MHPTVLHVVAHTHVLHAGLLAEGIHTRLQPSVGLRGGRWALKEARGECAFVDGADTILALRDLDLVLRVDSAELLCTLQRPSSLRVIPLHLC